MSHLANKPRNVRRTQILSICLGLVGSGLSHGQVVFIPATPENTTLADGTRLRIVDAAATAPEEITRANNPAANHWQWHPELGNGGGFVSSGELGNDSPMLRTVATGLTPKSSYRIYGFFWIGGFKDDKASPKGDDQWDIRLGYSMAKMRSYAHEMHQGMVGTLGPMKGGNAIVRHADQPIQTADGPLIDKQEDRRLYRVFLGSVFADANGTVIMYVDDRIDDPAKGRTCYDGMAVEPDANPTVAADTLHLAIRSGDWETARREIEASADLNSLDGDGLTCLFYLTAAQEIKRVAAFLKAGASPDVAGQAISPLWAAATAGDAELTRMLLDAGAKVAEGPLDPSGLKVTHISSALAHPAVAAIRSGSVTVLELLLKKVPNLNLDLLFASDWQEFNDGPPSYPLLDAVANNHPEMVEYLLSRSRWLDESTPETAGRVSLLLTLAARADPPMPGVVKLLAQRAESANTWPAYAAAIQRKDLAALPLLVPRTLSPERQSLAIHWARSTGDPQVGAMVEAHFPNAKSLVLPKLAEADEKPVSEEVARAFKPRSKPRAAAPAKGPDWTLAVIGSQDAAGPAAAIAAAASNVPGWLVVERQEIETLLRERDMQVPGGGGLQDIASLGDKLSADVLLFVSSIKSEALSVLRVEAVDVVSGLVVDRQHIDAKKFDPAKFSGDYLPGMRAKIQQQRGGQSLTAVTLLPVTAPNDLPNRLLFERLCSAGLMQEIDTTAGMIALTRAQMQPIIEERVFQQAKPLWGAAWTIEGGITQQADQLQLALRLKSLSSSQQFDVKAAGKPAELPAMVRTAWAQLLAAAGTAPQQDPSAAQKAKAEAAQLLREAQLLLALRRFRDASELIHAAIYLGADPKVALPVLLATEQGKTGYAYVFIVGESGELQEAGRDQAFLIRMLELLRVVAGSYNQYHRVLQDGPGLQAPLKDYWNHAIEFIRYRERFVEATVRPELQPALLEFDAELIPFLTAVFGRYTQGHIPELRFELLPPFTETLANRIPALGPLYAQIILSEADDFSGKPAICSASAWTGLKDNRRGADPLIVASRTPAILPYLAKALAASEIRHKPLRQAELAFLQSQGASRASSARAVVRARAVALADLPPGWVDLHELARWVPTLDGPGQTMTSKDFYPEGGDFLPALVASPRLAPDLILRVENYQRIRSIWQNAHDPKLRPKALEPLYSSIEDIIREFAKSTEPELAESRVAARISRMERLFALDFTSAVKFKKRPASINPPRGTQPSTPPNPPAQGNVGSKGQFKGISSPASQEAKLLVDLTAELGGQAAMIADLAVDPKIPYRIWVLVQPLANAEIVLQAASDVTLLGNQPWLMAVDARSGKVDHRINLPVAAMLMPEAALAKTSKLYSIRSGTVRGPLVFNDTHLLVNFSWGDPKAGPTRATLLVNRHTGTVEILPPPLQHISMESGQLAAGLGDSFFIVINPPAKPEAASHRLAQELWRVKPGAAPKLLARNGRRPEESPFDAADRQISKLWVDGQRLLVGSAPHFEYFDLQKDAWVDGSLSAPQWLEKIRNEEHKSLMATGYRTTVSLPDGSRPNFLKLRSIDSSSIEPGCLSVELANKRKVALPVRLEVPATFPARFQVFSNPASVNNRPASAPVEWLPVQDLLRTAMVVPRVIAQTDDKLILAMSPFVPDALSDLNFSDLPFLWTLEKQPTAEAIKKTLK